MVKKFASSIDQGQKKVKLMETESNLESQKNEFKFKMKTLKQKREQLDNKERKLKEGLLKFEKFLRENDQKKTRAIKIATEEKK